MRGQCLESYFDKCAETLPCSQVRNALGHWLKRSLARAFNTWLMRTTRKGTEPQEDHRDAIIRALRQEIEELKAEIAGCSSVSYHRACRGHGSRATVDLDSDAELVDWAVR